MVPLLHFIISAAAKTANRRMDFPIREIYAIFAGTTEGRGPDAVSGQEAVLRRIQVSQVQTQMDVGQQLGQYGTGVHQMSHKRVSSQAGERGGVRGRLLRPVTNSPPRLIVRYKISPPRRNPRSDSLKDSWNRFALGILRGQENEISCKPTRKLIIVA